MSSRGTSHGSKNLVTAEEPHRLIVKRNLTGEQGKSTTTPGTSPRRNSNQRNLDPEEPPARRTSEQQRNLTASSSRGTSQVRGPDSQRQGEIQGKKRQGVAQGKKAEGTLVVRRSQARGRMASQPHTNHHARAKADRQTDRTGSNPHTDQTPQRESPPPKDTALVVTTKWPRK